MSASGAFLPSSPRQNVPWSSRNRPCGHPRPQLRSFGATAETVPISVRLARSGHHADVDRQREIFVGIVREPTVRRVDVKHHEVPGFVVRTFPRVLGNGAGRDREQWRLRNIMQARPPVQTFGHCEPADRRVDPGERNPADPKRNALIPRSVERLTMLSSAFATCISPSRGTVCATAFIRESPCNSRCGAGGGGGRRSLGVRPLTDPVSCSQQMSDCPQIEKGEDDQSVAQGIHS